MRDKPNIPGYRYDNDLGVYRCTYCDKADYAVNHLWVTELCECEASKAARAQEAADMLKSLGFVGRSCANCRYIHDSDPPMCRRHAPVLTFDGERLITRWPNVGMNDWCGEFNPSNGGNGRNL